MTRTALDRMEGQEHFGECCTHAAEQRANLYGCSSGGQLGDRECKCAAEVQSVFPRTVEAL